MVGGHRWSGTTVIRQLKVRARLSSDLKTVTYQPVKMTHKGYEFGGNSKDTYISIFVHERVHLAAMDCNDHPTIFRGVLKVPMGGPEVKVPVQYWPEIKEAILAYNQPWKKVRKEFPYGGLIRGFR